MSEVVGGGRYLDPQEWQGEALPQRNDVLHPRRVQPVNHVIIINITYMTVHKNFLYVSVQCKIYCKFEIFLIIIIIIISKYTSSENLIVKKTTYTSMKLKYLVFITQFS